MYPVAKTPYAGIQIQSHSHYSKDVGGLDKHEFYRRTLWDLDYLYGFTNLGRELIQLIGKRSQGIGTSLTTNGERTVTIRFRPCIDRNTEGAGTGAWHINDRFNRVSTMTSGRKMYLAGRGSRSIVAMHNSRNSGAIYTAMAGVPTPTWMALFHELIHAWHQLSGTSYQEEVHTPGGTARREEMFTTGLGVYKDTRISENALRRELGMAERPFYTFPNDFSHITSLQHFVNPRVRMGMWHCSCMQQNHGTWEP